VYITTADMNSPAMPSFGNFKKVVVLQAVKESTDDMKTIKTDRKKEQEGIKRKDEKKRKERSFLAMDDGMKRSRRKKHDTEEDDQRTVEEISRGHGVEGPNTKHAESYVQPYHKTISSPSHGNHIGNEGSSRSNEDSSRKGEVVTPKSDLLFKSTTSLFSIRRMPDYAYIQHGGIHKQDLPYYDQHYKGIVGLDGRMKGRPTIMWSRDQRSFSILSSPLLSRAKTHGESLGYYESLVEALYEQKSRIQNEADCDAPPRTSSLYHPYPSSSSASIHLNFPGQDTETPRSLSKTENVYRWLSCSSILWFPRNTDLQRGRE